MTTTRVKITNDGYDPAEIKIATGDKVIWTNEGNVNHTVTMLNDNPPVHEIEPGKTAERIFPNTGTFIYSCKLHTKKRGQVTVA